MKKITLLVLILLFVFQASSCSSSKTSQSNPPIKEKSIGTTASETNEVAIEYSLEDGKSNYSIGDTILFGHYEQDNKESNGKENIKWKILDKQDEKLLMISEYGLENRSYNDKFGSGLSTWEWSTVRKWLNNDFYQAAFTNSDRVKIISTDVSSEHKNLDNDMEYTQDYVFLLDVDEVQQYFDNNDKRVKCTEAAKNHGACEFDGYGMWWLRSPGETNNYAAYVDSHGVVQEEGEITYSGVYVVRPVIWIDVNKNEMSQSSIIEPSVATENETLEETFIENEEENQTKTLDEVIEESSDDSLIEFAKVKSDLENIWDFYSNNIGKSYKVILENITDYPDSDLQNTINYENNVVSHQLYSLSESNDYILSLNSDKFGEIKETWTTLYSKIISLNNSINASSENEDFEGISSNISDLIECEKSFEISIDNI